ncbi:MAG: glycine--tRNA ligase subunit beta, partial [Hydrogenobacter sp.]
RWICALYGDQVVPLSFGSVQAGKKTKGHRFLSQGWIELRSASEYEERLKEQYVIPDFKERWGMILNFLKEESYALGGSAEYPEGLDQEVANLVEFPFAVVGSFDEKYLQLPQKVIVTVLAHHQRFFCVKKQDKLLPNFIAISGNFPKNNLIVKGYEKVVKARLEDALFFYKEDQKVRLEDLVEKLSQVVFHPKAGSMLEKTQRLITLSEEIGKALSLDENTLKKLKRASYLSKADLLTHMVREFDELQGYMGYVYALLQGEDQETALAIYEHYLPKSPSDPLPSGTVGKVLSLADKIDNLVMLIRVGEVPSGSSDPYGLRRYAYAVFSIIEDTQWDLNLRELIEKTYGGVDNTLEEFLKNRLETYLEPYGYDVARAVLEVHDPLKPLKSINTAKRIASLKEEQKFKDVVSAYRRVVKILPKDWGDSVVDERALREEEEKNLWEKLKELKVEDVLDLQPLKEYIDNFFDKVLVMDKDEQIRRNRLALLLNVNQIFNKFANFEKLVYEEV